MNEPTNCPHCNVNLIGEPIPDHILEFYDHVDHYKREIGIYGDYLGIYDGIVAFQCPDCKKTWPRDNSKWAMDLYSKYRLAQETGFDPW